MRIIEILINGLGIGEAHDCDGYGDCGANTYDRISTANIPTLRELGIDNIFGCNNTSNVLPIASFARLSFQSIGKSARIGQYEIAGWIQRAPLNDLNGDEILAHDTVYTRLANQNILTYAIGDTATIIKEGLKKSYPTSSNEETYNIAHELLTTSFTSALLTINFDITRDGSGNKGNVATYRINLEEVDSYIRLIINKLFDNDVLIVTAPYASDPTFADKMTTREFVPLMIYGKRVAKGKNLGTIRGADRIAHSILDAYGVMTTMRSIKNDFISKPNQVRLLKK